MRNSPSNSSVVLIAFVTALVTSVFTVIVMVRLNPLPMGGAMTIPDVRGLKRQAALEILQAKGLTLIVSSHQVSNDKAPNTVLSQSPFAGTQGGRGSVVTVILASEASCVPDVIGRGTAEATMLIEQARFKIVVGQAVHHKSIPKGSVAQQLPKAGMAYDQGRSVTVRLSNGPDAKPVPKVVGLSLKQAKKAIKKAGFKAGKIDWTYDEDWGSYEVLKQEPGADEETAPGSAIDLVVNED